MYTHHAYLTFAPSLETSSVPLEYQKSTIDVYHLVTPRLAIDDARLLTLLSEQRPFEAPMRTFVIVTNDIALEAQNALLKLFEEPPKHAQFYVVVPKTAFLLPTLKSRLSVINNEEGSAPLLTSNETFDSFALLSYANRLLQIAEKTKAKDLVWTEAILQGFEVATEKATTEKELMLKTVVLIRSYIGSKGSSAKMLLEEMALVLPVTPVVK
jgi:DNA polymerase III delta prime subunit